MQRGTRQSEATEDCGFASNGRCDYTLVAQAQTRFESPGKSLHHQERIEGTTVAPGRRAKTWPRLPRLRARIRAVDRSSPPARAFSFARSVARKRDRDTLCDGGDSDNLNRGDSAKAAETRRAPALLIGYLGRRAK
jgi:hypothetical protein